MLPSTLDILPSTLDPRRLGTLFRNQQFAAVQIYTVLGKAPAARRRLNLMQSGEISVPLPHTNDQLR